MFTLKPLSRDAIPAALDKAVRYRLLNESLEAESICRDVLEIEPDNQQALATLVLALTDQFGSRLMEAYHEAQQVVAQLTSEYERAYYSGIICERRGKARFRQGTHDSGSMAYDWFCKAMQFYEQAEPLRPADNDEAILRWNTCARILSKFPEIRPLEEVSVPGIDLE